MMKKIVLSLTAVFAFGLASAQSVVVEDVTVDGLVSSKGEYYLPQAGDWSIGFNAGSALTYLGSAFSNNGANGSNLFGATNSFQTPGTGAFVQPVTPPSTTPQTPPSSFSFVGKQFVSNNEAVRYTANFNLNYAKQGDNDASTQFGFVAGYGKEWRKGSTRLQGFYGADGLLGFSNFAEKTMALKVGAQGFVGAEYFIFPKVALGAQYTYGVFVEYSKVGDTTGLGINLGNAGVANGGNVGVGTASVLLNLYF